MFQKYTIFSVIDIQFSIKYIEFNQVFIYNQLENYFLINFSICTSKIKKWIVHLLYNSNYIIIQKNILYVKIERNWAKQNIRNRINLQILTIKYNLTFRNYTSIKLTDQINIELKNILKNIQKYNNFTIRERHTKSNRLDQHDLVQNCITRLNNWLHVN